MTLRAAFNIFIGSRILLELPRPVLFEYPADEANPATARESSLGDSFLAPVIGVLPMCLRLKFAKYVYPTKVTKITNSKLNSNRKNLMMSAENVLANFISNKI